MNSKQLWNRRTEMVEAMNKVMAEDMDEARRIEGEIRALDATLAEVINEEAEARAAAAANPVATDESATLGEKLFGVKAQFQGINPGFKATAPVKDAVSGLPTPQIYRRDLPGPVAPPTGFLSTLPKGTTDGDEHFFKTPVLTNAAAGWTSGDKPESALEWTEGVAHIETIAHWIPIKKQTANRYAQLESIVANALMMGLDLKSNEYALRGSNSSGIVGVTNTTGILTHTLRAASEKKNLKDEIQTMARKVRVATGIAPNFVCLSPYAIEQISQSKDADERYLFDELSNGGTVCGLTVVEDVNMTDAANSKETALVYYNGGATFDIADPEEIAIGLVNSQFIQNEYTLLAELTAALRVDTPAAFCYCADLGLTVEE